MSVICKKAKLFVVPYFCIRLLNSTACHNRRLSFFCDEEAGFGVYSGGEESEKYSYRNHSIVVI